MAWIRMQWFGFFGCIALIDAVRYVFGSVVAGSTISLALFLAPEPVSSALVATLPLVSFALSRGAKKRIGHSGAKKPVSRVDLLLMIRSVLVFVLACSFMAGIANVGDSVKGNVGGAAGMSLAYLAMALASLLIIYMVVECKKVPSVSILWKSVLVYILVYFFGVDILANVAWGFEVLNGSLLVVRSIAVSAMMVLLANVCLYLKQNPYFVFSAGFSIWSLGVSGSTLLCMMIMDNSVLSAATALAVMLVVILVPQVKDFGETRLLGDLTRKNALMVDMRRKCAAIAKRYKLSPREEEVMEYMCKGRSRPYIAEAMMLSENTIASHAKNIYTKIGVHSKQELIDMVESILEDG